MFHQSKDECGLALSTYEDEDYPIATDVGPFIRMLFEKQLYTDVTFYSSDDKATISAHRLVLAAKCDFFESLLYGDQKKESKGMEMQVQISNVPFSIFTNIIKYFYTNDIEFPDDYTVLEIYAAAQSFRIQHLIDKCKIYVGCIELTEDNVCTILQACNSKHVEELKIRCIDFIEKNTYQVVRSTDFEKCSFTTVREIFELQSLNLTSEVELLEAVLRWIGVQPSHTKKELTKSLIKCVRFLSFTPKEFSDVLQRHPDILTSEEGLNVLMHLNNPTPESSKSLPKWCNRNRRSFGLDYTEVQKDLLRQFYEGGRIKISLKPTKEAQDITELTSVLHLTCIKGMHEIKSISFSFEDVKNDGSLLVPLVIRTQFSSNGPEFHKNHIVRSKESTFTFSKSVKVFKGQTVQFEVLAKISETGRFLLFDRWHNDPKKDFKIFLSTNPKQGKLNFISGVEYGPLVDRRSTSTDEYLAL